MSFSRLRSALPKGHITMIFPNGRREQFGDGTGEEFVIRLKTWSAVARVALRPELHFGEAYMDETLVFERGDLAAFLALFLKSRETEEAATPPSLLARAGSWASRMARQRNGRSQATRNVAHHYDLSTELYRQFLDEDLYYSCAYFSRPDMTLEEAQRAKVRHLASKLCLQPGQRVLDIGSGWGGLAVALATSADVRVDGVTLSTGQLEVAKHRAEQAGLSDRVRFSLTDYRDVRETYDRIISVGMFEHVGAPNFDAFFETVRDRLAPDGVAVIHAIGRRGPPGGTNPWIDKYIFPGGYVPALSETLAAVERSGLWVTDIEILRLHYAETCRQWRQRFHEKADIVRQMYDDRFFRMWDFYLAVSEMGFRYGGLMVFQLQLARQVGTLPITRDYMVEAERGEM